MHCCYVHYRYVCEDTLEPNIMELQEAKRALGSGALKKLTPEEARKVTHCTLHNNKIHFELFDRAADWSSCMQCSNVVGSVASYASRVHLDTIVATFSSKATVSWMILYTLAYTMPHCCCYALQARLGDLMSIFGTRM
jgi:hypothetical protein